jgi:hypothetical protein
MGMEGEHVHLIVTDQHAQRPVDSVAAATRG